MALATQCPACETVFRIGTTQAAAKSGMVRCGICGFAFNALDVLVRVEDLPLADGPTDEPVQAAPVDVAEEGEVEPTVPAADEPVAIDTEASAEVSEPVETDDAPAVREWWLPPDGKLPEPPSPSSPIDAPAEPGRDVPLADQRLDLAWPRGRDDAGEGTGPEFMRSMPPERAPRSRLERSTLAVLSVVAIVVLAGQAIYVWRDELAARWPAARPALATVCSRIGCRVDYPAHIDAITIESTNVQVNAPNGTLYVLTALLRNRDRIDLRYPHLALTLTDMQDQPVLRRVLRPEDYLPAARIGPAFAAESELPIRVMFELNDLRFSGFRLDRFNP